MNNQYPKIMLIGSSGQLGTALSSLLVSMSYLTKPENKEFISISSYDLEKKLKQNQPNIIINTLAYTAVDDAENDKEKALLLNAILPKMISDWCYKNKCLFIHYSSDYVFSGSDQISKTETSIAKPINFYGYTKLQGDLHIKHSRANSIILRCSWIYSISHKSFLKTMMNKMQALDEIRVVDDQIGTPTSAQWIAFITLELIRNKTLHKGFNIINCVPNGYTSWYEFSKLILEILKSREFELKTKNILPINSEYLSQKVLRPKNSRLNNQKLYSLLNNKIPEWQNLLEQELKFV